MQLSKIIVVLTALIAMLGIALAVPDQAKVGEELQLVGQRGLRDAGTGSTAAAMVGGDNSGGSGDSGDGAGIGDDDDDDDGDGDDDDDDDDDNNNNSQVLVQYLAVVVAADDAVSDVVSVLDDATVDA
eukprot:CFRG2283T1